MGGMGAMGSIRLIRPIIPIACSGYSARTHSREHRLQPRAVETYYSAALSISRVLPIHTASAMCVPCCTCFTGAKVSGSKNST